MKHMSMLCIMSVSLCAGINAATQWMKLSSNLPRIISATNIQQSADRLIEKSTVNFKTLFVGNKGKVIPLLPEPLCAHFHRQDTAQERDSIKHLDAYINSKKFRDLDEWHAENRRVILGRSNRKELLAVLRQWQTSIYPRWQFHHYMLAAHLEDVCTLWYYPHGDWMKLVNHCGVHEEQIIEPSYRTDLAAFPVIELSHPIVESHGSTEKQGGK